MCRFEYKKYDTCGDYGIEVYNFCDQALWKSGVHGVLQVCIPEILNRSIEWPGPEDDEPPQVVTFIGYEGFCALCVDKYKLPPTTPTRSYSDRELNYWKQPSTFDPHSLAPYILARGFWARIPSLLGIVDQFEDSQTGQGPYIMFPKILEQLTWSELRDRVPFTSHGVMEDGCCLDLEVLEGLFVSGGISDWDKECMLNAMQAGISLQALYDMFFKPRGMPYDDFDAIIECLRAAAIQVLSKTAEDIRERESRQRAEISDISTLTSLATTPELSDFNDVPLPTQSTTAVKAAHKPKSQKHHKPEDKQKTGTPRKGSQAQAPKPAKAVMVAQSTQERPSFSRPRQSSKKSSKKKKMSAYQAEQERRRGLLQYLRDHDNLDDCGTAVQSADDAIASPTPAPRSSGTNVPRKNASIVSLPVDPNERTRKIAEQERTIEQLRQRKPASVGFGNGNTAQPSLGGGFPVAVEQTSGVATVGDRTAGNAANDVSAGAFSGHGAWTMRRSAAENSDPRIYPTYGYGSSPQYQGAAGFPHASETQWPRRAQMPQTAQNAAAIQAFQLQEYFNNVIVPNLTPEALQDLAQSTGYPFFQATGMASRPAMPASGGWQQQAYHHLPQPPWIPTQLPGFGSQPLAHGLPLPPQAPAQPAFPTSGGWQQQAYELPHLPQTPIQFPGFGSHYLAHGPPLFPQTATQLSGFGSQHLAHGLPQLHHTATQPLQFSSQRLANGLPQLPPQISPQTPHGAQVFQSSGQPRDEMTSFVGSRGPFYLPTALADDGDEDLQYSSQNAWQDSNRKRKGR
ncbi:hypothetical protein VSDG_00022 [Cytospora chrysosperma]|uniref:Uncharacterized protein n=1 Tax=Cytospora chrysosperma TaxID=252740 RepID=A0A423WPJ3_CYTCH|nr:hypothetical protein VSDG_00022 [Valsa sordida]